MSNGAMKPKKSIMTGLQRKCFRKNSSSDIESNADARAWVGLGTDLESKLTKMLEGLANLSNELERKTNKINKRMENIETKVSQCQVGLMLILGEKLDSICDYMDTIDNKESENIHKELGPKSIKLINPETKEGICQKSIQDASVNTIDLIRLRQSTFSHKDPSLLSMRTNSDSHTRNKDDIGGIIQSIGMDTLKKMSDKMTDITLQITETIDQREELDLRIEGLTTEMSKVNKEYRYLVECQLKKARDTSKSEESNLSEGSLLKLADSKGMLGELHNVYSMMGDLAEMLKQHGNGDGI